MANLPIPNEDTWITYSSQTGTGPFSFTFSIFAKADLRVTVGGVELTQSDFTFTGTLIDTGYDGGSITLSDAAAAEDVVIWREVAPVRSTDFAPASSIPVVSIDAALDRLTAHAQDARRDIDRAIKVTIGEAGTEQTYAAMIMDVAEEVSAETVDNVVAAGSTAINSVNAAGVAQVDAVNAAGDALLDPVTGTLVTATADAVQELADAAAVILTPVTGTLAVAETAAIDAVALEGDDQVARVAGTPGSTIYADTTAGLAATASGSYFMVVGTGDKVATVYKDNAGSAEVQEAFPSYDYVAAAVAALSSVTSLTDILAPTRKGDLYNRASTDALNSDRSFTIGVPTPVTGSAMPTGTYIHVGHPVPAGALKSFVVYGLGTKTIKLKRFSVDGLTYTWLDEISLNIVAGTNTFLLSNGTLTNGGNPWRFNEGDFLAIYVPSSAVGYATVTSNVMEYLFTASDVTTTYVSSTSPSPNRANQLQYLATFTSSPRAHDLHQLDIATNSDLMFVGPYLPGSTDTVITPRITYFWPELDGMECQRVLETIKYDAFAAVNGIVSIYDLDANGYSMTRSRMFQVSLAATSSGVLVPGVDFPPDVIIKPGGVVAFMQTTNTNGLRAATTQGSTFQWTQTNAPPATIALGGLSTSQTTHRPQIGFGFRGLIPARKRPALFDNTYSTNIPRSMAQTNWAISGGKAVSSTGAFGANRLGWSNGNSNKRTCVSGTYTEYVVMAATSAFAMYRNRTPNGGTAGSGGSIATVENTTGVICLRGPFVDETTLPAASVATTTAAWMIGNTNKLRCDLVKSHYAVSFTVTDMVTGNTATVSRTAAQGVADRSIVGLCNGAPSISRTAGTVSTYRGLFVPAIRDPNVIFFGDSITHGEGGTSGVDGWAYQAAAVTRGLISAVPSDTSTNVVQRIRDELQAYRPKHAVIHIGTNDTNMTTWQQNIARIYYECLGHDVTPWFCTLNPQAATTAPVLVQNPFLYASGYNIIDTVRAMTTGGDGTTLNTGLMADTKHPTAAGYAAMYAKFLVDGRHIADAIAT